jgi:hypothetical protein
MSDPRRIYNAFDPAPLHEGQQALYVELDSARGETSTVARLREKIQFSNGPTCQVLAGHRGCGKSTELWRLRQSLERPANASQQPYFVVQVQADKELDINDIDFPEILIAIIRQLAEQMRERLGIDLKPGYFKDRVKLLKELAFTEVDFEKIELSKGMAKISGMLRGSPEARKKVRAALEPDTSNWVSAANDVIGVALLELKKEDFAGLVLIIDDLDKMTTRELRDCDCLTTEHLFVHRAAQLTGFQCHVIYTLPIELAYSHHESSIRRLYSGHLPIVPMTKIQTPPPDSQPYAPGIALFHDIITARLTSVGACEADLFENDSVRDELIAYTGGQPTELMSLIREAIISDGLPIGTKGLHRCFKELVRSYNRQLLTIHWPLIQEARATGSVTRSPQNETALRQLLESRALLLYINDREWYGLNPAVSQLTPPPQPAPAA